MKQTLEYILKYLVDHPEDIRVEEVQEDDGIVLEVSANPEDMGKIIGRNGRIIRAIRDVIKIMATKEDVFVDVALME